MSKSRFRPCIDLHQGQVKQIVGGTLTEQGATENFVSAHPPAYFAEKFQTDQLEGGHVIMLGPGNEEAAAEALAAYPHGLQIGGGINPKNAQEWLSKGASHVIVTSYLFENKDLSMKRVEEMAKTVTPQKLVIDLSCRASGETWFVATDRWQTVTTAEVTHDLLNRLEPFCAEFLIHAADVEGKSAGIDERLAAHLGTWNRKPITYAGGVHQWSDLDLIQEQSGGTMDVTIGSALDLFGGDGFFYEELVKWNHA